MAIAEETAGNPNLPNKRQNAGGSKVIAIDTTSTCVAADISADDRRCKNEDSCPIYKLSNDELNLIFVYVGEMQYRFVACASDRFHRVYLEAFGNEILTTIESAVDSVSCAKLYLFDTESRNCDPDCDNRAKALFDTAASGGKLEVLKWGQESGYRLDNMLGEISIANAAFDGHIEVVKYLIKLGIPWDGLTCVFASVNGHINILKWARAHHCPWDAARDMLPCCR
jgi:hypothetical protein